MPNLVGIGLSQVPTNSMLGGLAYQDPEHASIKDLDLKNLSQINSEIADTAVDIFIYDTSKDSDGGAWRKRTTHTSWYNETLGTAIRGTRREFPAVAVIVAEAGKVTIYDGDDPDLPMWMVFDRTSTQTGAQYTNFLAVANINIANIFMLNGVLCVAFANGGWGVSEIGFVSDSQKWWWTSGIYKQPANTIAERHVEVSYYAVNTSSSVRLGNANIQDLAMAVQPNAKVNIATGLPVPTIALGTDAQANIITSDGSVVELTGFSPTDTINIDGSHVVGSTSSSGGNDFIFRTRIPSSDEAFNAGIIVGSKNYYMNSSAGTTPLLRDINHTHVEYDSKNQTTYRGGNSGFDIIVAGETISNSSSKVAVAYATTSFNTGYMVGDIKGAFLSDTDTTNVTGSELITNGTFDSNVNGWSGTLATVSHQTNKMRVTNTATNGWAYQGFSVTSGKKYVATINLTSLGSASTLWWRIGTDSNPDSGSNIVAINANSTGVRTVTFTASQSTLYFIIRVNGVSGNYLEVDNISVRLAEEDRSVNNKGLQVFGTITKSAVATGAELVAYSGYSGSNYLIQPSISAPGTGDFSVSAWIKPGSADGTGGSYFHLFSLGTSSTGGQSSATGFVLKFTSNSGATSNGISPYFYSGAGQDQGSYNVNNILPLGVWGHIVAMRRNGVAYIYLNGKLVQTGNSWTTNITDTYLTVFLGLSQTNETGAEAEVSLLRYSLSAPSSEQVKKIYEDEKMLFQENAACTIYGSSGGVDGLAYDEVTEQLHVGTSSGRSDFQGLRRINNTTTAVTTAISAHDGFIVEQ